MDRRGSLRDPLQRRRYVLGMDAVEAFVGGLDSSFGRFQVVIAVAVAVLLGVGSLCLGGVSAVVALLARRLEVERQRSLSG